MSLRVNANGIGCCKTHELNHCVSFFLVLACFVDKQKTLPTNAAVQIFEKDSSCYSSLVVVRGCYDSCFDAFII